MLKSGMNNLWPTEVYLGKIENKELLNDFCQYLFLNEDLSTPMSGNLSKVDLLRDGPPEAQNFRDKIVWPAFENYLAQLGFDISKYDDRRLKSWLTGSQNGYSITAHNHSGASVSAVFYLLCDENQGGDLILMDPRANANRGFKPDFQRLFENKTYKPRSGEFVMFPSYVYHHTVPFTGKLRLAMPVDLFL